MREYKTLITVDLCCGRIGLADEQARSRAGRLKEVRKGVYEIVAPVQFKAGEIIRMDAVPKGIRSRFEIARAKDDAEKPA